jgi:S-(hydroxymethyl)glutathione dehydrogenase/alcohol dehydrogenase
VVVTGLAPASEVGIPVSLATLTLYQKRIQGSLFGASNATYDIPRQVQMYRDGKLKLDELITREYDLDEVAQGYEDMHAGVNIRGVIRF